MGLCKCPQRKVSTLFCFQHHVNVCESCLVNEHSQCIVRSYISWLQDNDYNPNCSLCQQSLSETGQETIRLICYDVFHWSCLDQYCRSLPPNTAPDGYACPICHTCIFPPSNLISPVAEQLRKKLSTVNWATRLPGLSSTNDSVINHDKQQQTLVETEKNGYVIVNPTASGNNTMATGGLSHLPHRTIDMTQTTHTLRPIAEENDPDNDKYKRRSVFTWFARWLRSRQTTNKKSGGINRNEISRTRYTIYMICIILFVFLTILTVLYHLTRGDNDEYVNKNDDDPQFNPLNNPFVRVAGRFLKNPVKNSETNNDQPK